MEIPLVTEDQYLSAFASPAAWHMGYSGPSSYLSLSRKPLKSDNKVIQQELHRASSFQCIWWTSRHPQAHSKVQEPQNHSEE